MKIDLKVVPGAKKSRIIEENGQLKVFLLAPAVDGKANKALIAVMAKHYDVKKSQVEIIKGLKSQHKTINILGLNT